jgi:four helix bundle protein
MRMLVGLRKHWSQATQAVHEEMAAYPAQDERIDRTCGKDGRTMPLFHHEALDVYRVALEATAAFCCSAAVSCLSNTSFRRLDELVTSMVLNIAEGNGRFSRADQARFLSTAYESAVKLAARLDLCVIQTLLPPDEVARCKMLLQRVSFMTVSMIADVQG